MGRQVNSYISFPPAGGGSGAAIRGSAAKTGFGPTIVVAQGDFDVAPVSGDIVIGFCAAHQAPKTGDITIPSGFTSKGGGFSTAYAQFRSAAKLAGGSEGSYTWTLTNNNSGGVVHMFAISGSLGDVAEVVNAAGAGSTDVDADPIIVDASTVTQADDLIVIGAAAEKGGGPPPSAFSTPSGMTVELYTTDTSEFAMATFSEQLAGAAAAKSIGVTGEQGPTYVIGFGLRIR